MPWIISNVMEQKAYFISLARAHYTPFTHLCQQFGISPKTGYKWLNRAKDANLFESIKDRSRKPQHSPNKTPDDVESILIKLRKKYPYWGAKKIMLLCKEQYPKVTLPSERTVNRIFGRYGLLTKESPPGQKYTHRFEYERPNDLWQMDYKGEFNYARWCLCFPLTVIDDHSRFNLVLDAHHQLSWQQTQESLKMAFIRYGMPKSFLMDRGALWYTAHSKIHWTRLTVWLMRLGIQLIFSSANHPQTLGKAERFHRTLKYDLIQRTQFRNMQHIQECFNIFQHEYNYIRPHEALGLQRPFQRYSKSDQHYPEKLPELQYPEGAHVKRLTSAGTLFYHGQHWFISEALVDQYVMLIDNNDFVDIFFNKTLVKTIDLKERIIY